MAKETSIHGVTLFTSDEDDFHLMYSHLNALFKNKSIKPVIGRLYSLKDADKAQDDVINNTGTIGRLTLVVEQQ